MGFFFNTHKKKNASNKDRKQAVSLGLCYKNECSVCSKNKDASIESPKMEPRGSEKPIIYILGDYPRKIEDEKGKHFIGGLGRLLINNLNDVFGSEYVVENIRMNTCVRCRSTNQPKPQEIMCCKKSIEQDIEKSKPDIIIGLGHVPLQWAINQSNIKKWRGRKIPIKIGEHTAWYFPLLDPKFLMERRGKKKYETEYDYVFKLDLQNIKKFLSRKEVPIPKVIDNGYTDNIYYVTGRKSSDYETVKNWLLHLKTLPATSTDIETSKLKPWNGGKILTISIGTDKEAYVFPIDHPDSWKDDKTREKVKVLLKDFLLNSGTKVAHYLKFELTWFLHYFGIEVLYETDWADTMAQAYVLDERSGDGILKLDTLCLQYYGFNLKDKNDLDIKNLLDEDLVDVLIYNGMDVKYTFKLFIDMNTIMPRSLKKVAKHHYDVCKNLALTETKGVVVNIKANARISRKLGKDIDKLEKELYKLPEISKYEERYGEKFNFASPPKLVKMFRDVLKIPCMKKTAKGGYGTDKEVLQILAKKGIKLAVYIEKLREVNKLKSTYVNSLPELTSEDGILRASFNSCGTDTGRLSSNEPNMQNFPKKNNSYVRKQIIAPKGYKFVAMDYRQLEATIICIASGETNIIEHDVHADWSKRILEIYPASGGVDHIKDMSPENFKKFRGKVKNKLVFPWFYGAGKRGVANDLGLPSHIVSKLYKDFYEYFSRVSIWQDKMIALYNKNGYAVGLTGRRRRAPLSRNQLLNNTIQGAASDIVVAAMNRLSKMSYDLGTDYYQPILNIHDDLSFYIPDEKLDEAIHVIAKEMVRDLPIMNKVPLEVEVSVGNNWHALEEYSTSL